MRSNTRILALLLALLMLTFSFVACNNDDDNEDEEPNTEDEFTGSISGGSESSGESTGTTVTPPIAEGDPNAVIEISTAEQLKNIAQNGTYILVSDIDMTGIEFTPIGNYAYPFKGTFKSKDGESYKITNLKVSATATSVGPTPTYTYVYGGLFGATKGATVTNITLENVDISATCSDEYCFVTAGGLAGYMINTTVTDCNVSGKINSQSKLFNSYGGGICGILEGGAIKSSTVNASIETKDSKNRAASGGMIALTLMNPTVEYCVSGGSVKAESSYGISYAGGIVGNTRQAVYTACRSEADVYAETLYFSSKEPNIGAAYAGGIVAVSSARDETVMASFNRCYALDKTVTANGNDCSAYAGGIAGNIAYTNFTHCYSLCNVVLKAESRVSYAASGFGRIESTAGEEGSENYVADYSVKGCFAYGGITVEHSNEAYALIGTFYGFITTDASKASIKSSYYNQEAVYTLNGKTNPSTLAKNGKARSSQYFTEEYINEFGWNASEWETVNGYLYAK